MEALRQAIREGTADRWLVVVPAASAAANLKRRLADERGAVFGLRVITLRALISQLAGQLSLPRLLSDPAAQEVIAQAAAGLKQGGMKQVLAQPSAQLAALAGITDLKLAGTKPSDLEAMRDAKLLALAELLREFDAFCREHDCTSPGDVENAVIEAAENGLLHLRGVEHLFVTGFPSIPPHRQRLLQALGRHVTLHLRLPDDQGKTGLFSTNESFLRRAEEKCGADSRPTDIACGGTVLGELQRSLFAIVAKPLDNNPERIHVSAAPRRYDEVEAAAGSMVRLIRNHGVAPSEICLAVRGLGKYDQYVRDVFAWARIPFRYRRGIPLLQAPSVRLAMKLTELASGAVRYEALLGILRSRRLAIGIERSEALAKLVLQAGVFEAAADSWAGELRSFAMKLGSELADAQDIALEWLKGFMLDCLGLWSKPLKSIQRLRALCEKYLQAPASACNQHERRDMEGWRRFHEVLVEVELEHSELQSLGLKPSVGPIDRLRERIKSESIRQTCRAEDAVRVLSFHDAAHERFDHLFILGLKEGDVPAPPLRSRSLLGDADIERMRAAKLDADAALPDSEAHRDAEAQAFLLACCSTRLTLYLSYPLIDDDGRETTISPYLGEIVRLLGIEKGDVEMQPGGDVRSLAEIPSDPLALHRQLARRLYRADLPDADPLTAPVFNRLLALEPERGFLRRLMQARAIEESRERALFNNDEGRRATSDAYSGRISDPALLAWIRDRFGPERAWSASALERFGTCPFDFFLRYCLELVELELPGEEPSYKDEGLLLHDIAHKFVKATTYPIANVEEAAEKMSGLIAEAFGKHFPERPSLPQRLLRSRVESMMRRFVRFEADLAGRQPKEQEYSFGRGGERCEIELPQRRILLAGIFDRVDRLTEGKFALAVIDYKRSMSSLPPFKSFVAGHRLQLPLYVLAAAKLFDATIPSVMAGIYSFRHAAQHEIRPTEVEGKRTKKDWPYYFGLSDAPNEKGDYGDLEPAQLIEIVDEIVAQVLEGYFPVEGRKGAGIDDLANLVARWRELPPEFSTGEAE